MIRRALITGISGQDRLNLAGLTLANGYDVQGLSRGQANPKWALAKREVREAILLTASRSAS